MAWLRRIELFLVGKLSWLLIEGVAALNRVTVEGYDAVRELEKGDAPLIYIFWHRHILFVIHRFRRTGARPLISLSSDGDRVAEVARVFGMDPIRGSSSRGGARAFLEMARCIGRDRARVLITADGPRGPARRVKEGAAQLAARTGAWVVPIGWSASRRKVLERSWDRFLVPLPCGRVRFAYGKPLRLEPDLSAEAMARAMARMAGELDALQRSLGDEPA
jgi:hypothetical protein